MPVVVGGVTEVILGLVTTGQRDVAGDARRTRRDVVGVTLAVVAATGEREPERGEDSEAL
ncbi:hypothetical protein [Nannocystis pusilla]|uniref:hypothetical protein n=1 Tax=Nannocystis pusilla TaxID=889268 RepID=UPI003B7FD2B0